MKRGFLAGCLVVFFSCLPLPSFAITTSASGGESPAIDSPLIITGYSISGDQLNYAQIYNDSNEVVSLDGWKLQTTAGAISQDIQELSGEVAPHNYVVAANANILASTTFSYIYSGTPDPSAEQISSIHLLPAVDSGFSTHDVDVGIKSTTLYEPTIPETYYFKRNTSSSTGNYLSTFTAFIPNDAFALYDDGLYVAEATSSLSIVAIYPHAPKCSPLATEMKCTDYVKLYNGTGSNVNLEDYRLRVGVFGDTATNSTTAYPSGVLTPGAYIAVPLSLTNGGSWVWLEDSYGTVVYDTTVTDYPDSTNYEGQAWAKDASSNTWRWTRYPNPNGTNKFTDGSPINKCEELRLSEIGANIDEQFIEIYNLSKVQQNLRGCQLQTNRSTTTAFSFPSTNLKPGGYVSVHISDTDLTLTKTTSGTVYLLSSDGQTEVDSRSYEDMNEDTSLALVDGVWRQTFATTPGGANAWQEFPACETGYFRNEETGRCNKVISPSVLSSCLSTQYRNPETNRCRNIASTVSSLKPCDASQYRNPLTNRCRSLASSTSSLKPCAANQERNPATNRCRLKMQSVPKSDFAVQTVQEGAVAFAGWWALGGVGTLAAGYGAWEWRREVATIYGRVVQFFTSGGK